MKQHAKEFERRSLLKLLEKQTAKEVFSNRLNTSKYFNFEFAKQFERES